MHDDLISICVTTRHRPALLMECLESLFRQAYRPLEVIVGDNSEDDTSERLIAGLTPPAGIALIYQRHRPTTDWAANNAWVFGRSRGTRVMLMHDDDYLCDGGLDTLVRAWDHHPDAVIVYGRVRHITFEGAFDAVETDRLNSAQLQQAQFAGRQASNEIAAIQQQVPPNGWLADGDLVRRIGCWRPPALVGTFCDIDFGLRLAKAAGGRPFVYVHEFVGCMRQGPTRLSNDRRVDIGAIRFLTEFEAMEFPPDCHEARDDMLRRLTEISVVEAARARRRGRAIELMRSPHYNRPWYSPYSIYRALCIVHPALGVAANRLLGRD